MYGSKHVLCLLWCSYADYSLDDIRFGTGPGLPLHNQVARPKLKVLWGQFKITCVFMVKRLCFLWELLLKAETRWLFPRCSLVMAHELRADFMVKKSSSVWPDLAKSQICLSSSRLRCKSVTLQVTDKQSKSREQQLFEEADPSLGFHPGGAFPPCVSVYRKHGCICILFQVCVCVCVCAMVEKEHWGQLYLPCLVVVSWQCPSHHSMGLDVGSDRSDLHATSPSEDTQTHACAHTHIHTHLSGNCWHIQRHNADSDTKEH